MKYIVIVLDGVEVMFIYPKAVDHDRMYEAMEAIRFGSERAWDRKLREGEVVSAGFITNGSCHGKSETMGVGSRPEIDTALFKKNMYGNENV